MHDLGCRVLQPSVLRLQVLTPEPLQPIAWNIPMQRKAGTPPTRVADRRKGRSLTAVSQ